jgi:GDP-fucose transporter C1
MSEASAEVRKQTYQSAAAVTFYMTVSIGLVFLNRLVLTDATEKAGALFMSWYQFVVAYLLILIITTFFPNVPLLNLFPPLQYQWQIVLKVIPVSVAYLLMIGFNNKCLEYVSVSGYQIVRSLTIAFNIVFTYFILGSPTSLRACFACAGVILGFFLGVEGEVNLSVRGAIYGVCSSVFVALYSIVVKRVIGLLDNNEYLLIESNTPIAIISLAPFVWWSGEFEGLWGNRTARFWIMQTLAGVVGFVINIAIFLNIKYTTPLTHNLSGTVKACLQTLLAFAIFKGETMGPMKFVGTVFVIGFSAYYAYVRKSEMTAKITKEIEHKAAAGDDNDDNAVLLKDSSFEDGEHSDRREP